MTGFRDRASERYTLDQLVDAVRSGHGQALVVRGDPGMGKTWLLDHLTRRASSSGCQVARVAGVQSEMELAFAGLHQLCAPMLGYAGRLPRPQQDALRIALGVMAGVLADAFLVGLAVLSLLSEAAAEGPLICVIDDEQWLDRASAQALGFAARRLAADPVGLVFASRDPGPALATLPGLEVAGLPDEDARALLESALTGPIDVRVRDLIIAETRGNPLALLELPRGLSPAELAGGFGLPGAAPLAGRIEDSFTRQLDVLPEPTRRLLRLAAADPSGDRALVWRAAARLGIPINAGAPAAEARLVEFGPRVQFRHPLARSAAYRSASFTDRQQLHAALAEVTDPQADPDRRAWHRAAAAAGPDDEVARELEQSAGRARARGGLAAAAAFLERAVALTADPGRHAERTLAAAEASMQAGAFGKVQELVTAAEAGPGPLTERQRAQVILLRGHVALLSGASSDGAALLAQAARQLEPVDSARARETYLEAWFGAFVAAGQTGQAHFVTELCDTVRALPPSPAPRPVDLMIDGYAVLLTKGHGPATTILRRAADGIAGMSVDEVLRWGWVSTGCCSATWDFEGWLTAMERHVSIVRDAGALERLPLMLSQLAMVRAWRGDFAGAAAAVAESDSVAAAIGSPFVSYGLLRLRGLQGREAEAAGAIAREAGQAAGRQGLATHAHWAAAVLGNGLGHYEEAMVAGLRATSHGLDPWQSTWALPELVEAAVRQGDRELAGDALARLAATTQPAGNDLALGLEARSRALLSDGTAAQDFYREAIDRLGRTRFRPELARAHLLYGEWLRREGRRTDARAQLRAAHEMLGAIGMEAFAQRARRELAATGETVRRQASETEPALTAQEALIARLASDGRTNPEIGAQLFLSARTVEWHLRKVFTRLGISSRRELRAALAQLGPADRNRDAETTVRSGQ